MKRRILQPNTWKKKIFGVLFVASAGLAAACSSAANPTETASSTSEDLASPPPTLKQVLHGRDIWLKSTFGGEKFQTLVLPVALGFHLGNDVMLTSPRATRFTDWGVVNDPDCVAGDASTFGFDKCTDPEAAGVVGVRKFPNPTFDSTQPPSTTNSPVLIGIACAGCHAGLDPSNPPKNPNAPGWANINLTTGNQYDQIGKIFGAHLTPSDPAYQVFHSWAPGTVDTTAIENDGVNNPGTITQFFVFPERPYFNNHYQGAAESVHRAGQGGEDDSGCERAALRVYFNLGMCGAECMLPHLVPSQSPIDLAACEQICPDLVQAEASVTDECAFINSELATLPPKLELAPGGAAYINQLAAFRGESVFKQNCASCHSNGSASLVNDYTDDQVHPATGFDPINGEPAGSIGTNKCRSLSTNWLTGQIWQTFSSDELKARGPGYYRDIPLLGIWATAPFFHNNRLGKFTGDPSLSGRLAAFEDAVSQLLNPQLRDFGASVQVTTAPITLPNGVTLPAGTPVNAFANVNPNTGVNLCPEYVENGGHYFGAGLSTTDKYDLKEYLKTL